MRVLIDTSVLVSAMLPDHIHHGHSRAWLEYAMLDTVDFVVSGHSLAERYAVLTRLPRTPRISPGDATKLMRENVLSRATVVTLSGDDYVDVIDNLSGGGVIGGAVYDGLIAKAAELAAADKLVTLNVTHFQRVWSAGANRIVSPQSESPP